MILIGIGSNLASDAGPPLATCRSALERVEAHGIRVVSRSPWYETAPVPASDQPWFVNGAAKLETALNPMELLSCLLAIETAFSRARGAPNAARTLDLDLLAYNDEVRGEEEPAPILPHPRLHERPFVLVPLRDLVPNWLHPTLKVSPGELLTRLPSEPQNEQMRRIEANP